MQPTTLEGFRLAPQQETLIRQGAGSGGPYPVQAAVALHPSGGAPAPGLEAIRAALSELVAEHEILRTVFRRLSGMTTPLQVILPEVEVELPVIDLADLGGEELEAAFGEAWRRMWERPWDREVRPALEAELVRTGEGESWLLLRADSLVADRRSMEEIVRRLIRRLTHPHAHPHSSGAGDDAVQYADAAEAFLSLLEDEEGAEGRTFWEGLPAQVPAELPGRRPEGRRARTGRTEAEGDGGAEGGDGPGNGGGPGPKNGWGIEPAVVPGRIDPELARRCRETADALGVDLSALLFTAWTALLARLSGELPSVGVILDGRTFEGLEDAVGPFARTVPAPASLRTGHSFAGAVRKAAESLSRAAVYQDFYAPPESDEAARDEPPLQVGFEAYAAPTDLTERPGSAKLRRLWAVPGAFRLSLAASLGPSEVGLDLTYDHRSFTPEGAENLVRRLAVLLEHAVAEPSRHLDELRVVGAAEARYLVEELNNTDMAWEGRQTVDFLVDRQAEATPERTALAAGDEAWSYAYLDRRAEELAGELARRGAGPETIVGVELERGPELVAALLAVLRTGAAYMPLEPGHPPRRTRRLLERAGCRLVVTADPSPALEDADVETVDPGRPAFAPEAAPPPRRSHPDQLAYVLFTSGSTGEPKGVMMPHRAITNRLRWMAAVFPLSASDRVLHRTPVVFDASIWEIFAPLSEGACVVLARPGGHQETDYLARLVAERRVTVMQMVPPQLRLFLEEEEAGRCDALVRVFAGGDLLTTAVCNRLRQRLPGADLTNLYGPTEAAIDAAFHPCAGRGPASGDAEAGSEKGDETAGVPIGRALANVRLHVVDRRRNLVPVGCAGELLIAGRGLARGYLGRPDLTAERFQPDPFPASPGARVYATGDRVRRRTGGEIEFLGRLDQQVKVRGIRLELGEVECLLAAHPDVAQATAALKGSDEGEMRLVAYAVPRPGTGPGAEELRAFLGTYLPPAVVPAHFVFLDALPTLPSGKVDRSRLPEPGAAAAVGDARPATSTEELVALLWSRVLGVDEVPMETSFFDLGGHSLLATRLASHLRVALGVEVGLRELFELDSVRRLAAHIDRRRRGPEAAAVIEPRGEGEPPLSFAQQRLWFIDRLDPGNAAYNIPNVVELAGELRAGALAAALDAVVERHEVLRTGYPEVRGEARPRVHADARASLPLVDLSGLPAGAARAEADARVAAEIRRPFDLARPPLLRALLVRIAPEEHVLALTLHHIVGDAWSSGVLLGELGALYRARAEGRPSPLDPLPIQYGDFAAWQRGHLTGDVLARHVAAWSERLRDMPPRLDLPFDRPRPERPSLSGGVARISVDAETSAALRELGRGAGATPFMVVLAAYKVLLARLTGRRDVVVGTDVANRNRAETEALIGFFINQLVLRTDLGGDPTFREVLERVREVTLEAYDHQDLPFDRLLDLLAVERTLSYGPLFQTKLFFLNVPTPPRELPGLVLTPRPADTGGAKLDLTLAFWEGEEGLEGWANYSTDLFDASTVERLLAGLRAVLEAAARRPDSRLAELTEILNQEEREMVRMETKQRKKAAFSKFRTIAPKPVAIEATEVVRRRTLTPDRPLPLILEPAVDDVDLAEWCRENREALEADLLRHGALLFRGFGITDAEAFEGVAGSLCDELFDENGEHPRETVDGHVYTPVFYPPDQKLLWHNENSFNYEWPRKIMFCAEVPAETGGETPLVDSRRVLERMPDDLRRDFEERGVRYVRNYGVGVGLSWQEVFNTESREEVEERCRREHVSFEWKDGDRLRTWTDRPAVIDHPVSGEASWFNQAQHWHTACLDPETRRSMENVFDEEDLPRTATYADGTPIPDAAMRTILDIYDQLEVAIPWQKGDVVVVDNVLTAHGRNPFTGKRKLLVALGDMATFEEA